MTHKNFETTYALLSEPRTKIMGILNVTPDSFAGDGIFNQSQETISTSLEIAERFINDGADIIDIGGESTRPGATPVDVAHELQRIIPVIKAIRDRFSIPLSIDTTKALVAKEALIAGGTIINDVSGLLMDAEMSKIVAESGVPVIIMHNPLARINLVIDTSNDITQQVIKDLKALVAQLISLGIKQHQIILDPGVGAGAGFGKTPLQDLNLIKNLNLFKELPYPILLGASRKSFIGQLTGAAVDQRLPASLAVATLATWHKADIIRVHDVAPTKQIIQLLEAI
jgi:dihydropteroate synthase